LLDSLLALLFEKPCPLVAHTDFSPYHPSPIRKWKSGGLTNPIPEPRWGEPTGLVPRGSGDEGGVLCPIKPHIRRYWPMARI
jgi:hypothetical protein